MVSLVCYQRSEITEQSVNKKGLFQEAHQYNICWRLSQCQHIDTITKKEQNTY